MKFGPPDVLALLMGNTLQCIQNEMGESLVAKPSHLGLISI